MQVGLLGAGIATGTRMATGAAYGTGESEEARELLAAADHARALTELAPSRPGAAHPATAGRTQEDP